MINDPKRPENNGRVFLFKFGKKIFDKIMDKARPTFEDEDPVNVFDYWDGANFKLRMKMVDGYPSYDSSEFESCSPVADSDEDILDVVNRQYRLAEFSDPKNFKTYEELSRKLQSVLSGVTGGMPSAAQLAQQAEDVVRPTAQPRPAATKPAPAPKSKPMPSDDDDMMEYFQSLADEE